MCVCNLFSQDTWAEFLREGAVGGWKHWLTDWKKQGISVHLDVVAFKFMPSSIGFLCVRDAPAKWKHFGSLQSLTSTSQNNKRSVENTDATEPTYKSPMSKKMTLTISCLCRKCRCHWRPLASVDWCGLAPLEHTGLWLGLDLKIVITFAKGMKHWGHRS